MKTASCPGEAQRFNKQLLDLGNEKADTAAQDVSCAASIEYSVKYNSIHDRLTADAGHAQDVGTARVDVRLRPDRASMGTYVRAKTPDKGIEAWLGAAGIGYVSLIELGNVFLDFDDWEDPLRAADGTVRSTFDGAPGRRARAVLPLVRRERRAAVSPAPDR